MKSGTLVLIVACLSLFGQSSTASTGEPDGSLHWSPGADVGTDYVWRGQSLTDGKPSVVGEIKLSHDSGAYAGIWAGNLDLGPRTDTSAEIDYFLGWAKKTGRLYINTGYLYRRRPSDTLSLDFQEVTAFASYDFGVASLGAGSDYSWDYFQGGRSIYNYTHLSVPIAKPCGVQLVAIAGIGHYDFSNRAIGDYSNIDLRVVAMYNSWEYTVGYSNSTVDPARSGLLTRNESGSRWWAQVLVMF